MNFQDYQVEASKTAIYPQETALSYLALGLGNEAGEVQGKVKKYLRGDYDLEQLQEYLLGELGDVLWYMSELADHVGLSLAYVAERNISKLNDRQERGVLQGDGDSR